MAQLPAPGEQAYAGSDVGLLVSKGMPQSTQVPKVTGLSEQAATRALAEAGLQAVPTEAYNDTVSAGVVAAQDPAAGQAMAPLLVAAEVFSATDDPDQVHRSRQGAEHLEGLDLAAAWLREQPQPGLAFAPLGPERFRVRHRLLTGENYHFR